MPDETRTGTGRRPRMLAKLSEPLDAPTPPRTSPQAKTEAMPQTLAELRAAKDARRAGNRDGLYARRLAEAKASGEPSRELMAYVDRIRASRNPRLITSAATALAQVIAQAPAAPA